MKLSLSLLLLFSLVFVCYGQDSRPVRPAKSKTGTSTIDWKEKLYYGGNVGLQMYGSGGFLDLSPNIGYKLNNYVSGGVQMIYTNIWNRYGNITYKYTFYGAGVFARLKTFNWLFLQAEYDLLNVPDNFSLVGSKRAFADVPLAGLGLRNQLSDNACYYLLFMYEFAPTPNSPYTYGPFNSPLVYRVGFNINF